MASTPELGPDVRLVVAGYTGSDVAAVRAHIDELAAIGVPPPASVPAYYPMDAGLLTGAGEIAVHGTYTSGEVEPVLVRANGRYWLTVGSDHTDRDLERDDVAKSKAVCAKPVAGLAIALDDGPELASWSQVRIRSWVDGVAYQDGTLAALRPLADVLAGLPEDDGGDLVLFGGTVPLLDGGFRAGEHWRLTLAVPGLEPLELTYSVTLRRKH